ncbi:hypothetical protein LTR97_000486 [Elasticomyces elasticus]|uniref:Uncharacterized protein n=1 Tax=Elasticomyces elasticus TaxID=574655 RepID=A0AAN7VXG3_9PEZI|nr:hypothetical protein LTR97_000486 [Elasticomyces elasticus]
MSTLSSLHSINELHLLTSQGRTCRMTTWHNGIMETTMMVETPQAASIMAGTRATATGDESYEKGGVDETEETFEDDSRSKMIALAGSEQPALWKRWSLGDSADSDNRVASVDTAEPEHAEMDTNQTQIEAQLATPRAVQFSWEMVKLVKGDSETNLPARSPFSSSSPQPWGGTTPYSPPGNSGDMQYILKHNKAIPGSELEQSLRSVPTPPTDPAHYAQLPPVPADLEPESLTLKQYAELFWRVWERTLASGKARSEDWVQRIVPTEQTEVQAKVDDVEAGMIDLEDEDCQCDVVMAQISQEVERRLKAVTDANGRLNCVELS